MPTWAIILIAVVLVIGFIYGPIQTLRSINNAQRRRKLKDWAAALEAEKPLRLKVDGDNAIILTEPAPGLYCLKHVFANANMVTVKYKGRMLKYTEAQVFAAFDVWVRDGLSPEHRVDGARQYTNEYVPPKKGK